MDISIEHCFNTAWLHPWHHSCCLGYRKKVGVIQTHSNGYFALHRTKSDADIVIDLANYCVT
jgi:hypothetical protein